MVRASAEWVAQTVENIDEAIPYYGINTGALAGKATLDDQYLTKVFSRNLMASHAVSAGEYFDEEIVRAAMLTATVQSTADQEPLLAHSLGAVSPPPRADEEQPLAEPPSPGMPKLGKKTRLLGSQATTRISPLTARNSSPGSEVPEAPADVRDVSTVQYLLTAINAPCCPDPTVEEAIEAAKMLSGVLEAEAIEGGIQVTYQPDVVEPDTIASTINRVSWCC